MRRLAASGVTAWLHASLSETSAAGFAVAQRSLAHSAQLSPLAATPEGILSLQPELRAAFTAGNRASLPRRVQQLLDELRKARTQPAAGEGGYVASGAQPAGTSTFEGAHQAVSIPGNMNMAAEARLQHNNSSSSSSSSIPGHTTVQLHDVQRLPSHVLRTLAWECGLLPSPPSTASAAQHRRGTQQDGSEPSDELIAGMLHSLIVHAAPKAARRQQGAAARAGGAPGGQVQQGATTTAGQMTSSSTQGHQVGPSLADSRGGSTQSFGDASVEQSTEQPHEQSQTASDRQAASSARAAADELFDAELAARLALAVRGVTLGVTRAPTSAVQVHSQPGTVSAGISGPAEATQTSVSAQQQQQQHRQQDPFAGTTLREGPLAQTSESNSNSNSAQLHIVDQQNHHNQQQQQQQQHPAEVPHLPPWQPPQFYYLDPRHPYAPPPDAAYARRTLERTLRRLLGGANYVNKDPGDPGAVALLRPHQLEELCDECGVGGDMDAPTPSLLHTRRAQRLAAIVQEHRHRPRPGPNPGLQQLGPGVNSGSSAAGYPQQLIEPQQQPGTAATQQVASQAAVATSGELPQRAPSRGAQTLGSGQQHHSAATHTGEHIISVQSATAGSSPDHPATHNLQLASQPAFSTAPEAPLRAEGDSRAAPAPTSPRVALARRVAAVMAQVAPPHQVAAWLVAARAQDVVVLRHIPAPGSAAASSTSAVAGTLSTPHKAGSQGGLLSDGDSNSSSTRAVGSSNRQAPVRGRAASTSGGYGRSSGVGAVVVATALSSRHAAACAEAVRWQIGQALEVYRGQAEAGSPMAAAAAVAAPPDIAGAGTGSDWLALDTGSVAVHLFGPQARAYYRVEEAFAGGQAALGAAAQGATVHVVDTSDATILRSSSAEGTDDSDASVSPGSLPASPTAHGSGPGGILRAQQGAASTSKSSSVSMERFIPHTQRVWTLDTLVAAHTSHPQASAGGQSGHGVPSSNSSGQTLTQHRLTESSSQEDPGSAGGSMQRVRQWQSPGKTDGSSSPVAGADSEVTSEDPSPGSTQPVAVTEAELGRVSFKRRVPGQPGRRQQQQRKREALFRQS